MFYRQLIFFSGSTFSKKIYQEYHQCVKAVSPCCYIAIVREPPCDLYIFCASTTAESRTKIWYQESAFKPPTVAVVVDSFLIVTHTMGVCNFSMFCYALLYVHSSFAIILMGKRELVDLLSLSYWCLVIVMSLFLAVPWVVCSL